MSRRRRSREMSPEQRIAGLAVVTLFLAITWATWWQTLSLLHLVAAAVLVLFWWQAIRDLRAVHHVYESREQLASLSPVQFETWCSHRLRALGYRVRHVGGQGDHGVDLLAEKEGERIVVQCKRFTGRRTVGEPQLRDLFGAMHAEGATRAILITAGYFTSEAREWASSKPIELWDIDRIARETPALPTTHVVEASIVEPTPECTSCGANLVVRRNRSTGEPFFGCSRYPSCRFTRPIESVVRAS